MAGDVYDFVRVDDRCVGLLVADVTGHGVAAALIASMVQVAYSTHAAHAIDDGQALVAERRAGLDGDTVTVRAALVDRGAHPAQPRRQLGHVQIGTHDTGEAAHQLALDSRSSSLARQTLADGSGNAT